MGPDEMFSLFSGFILATFLIWLTGFIVGDNKKNVHKEKKTKDHPNTKCPRREETHSWNVSTFFRLHTR